jgi:hypothetical protein
MNIRWMLAAALTLFIAQGAHAQDYTPNPAATPSEQSEPRKPGQIRPTVSLEGWHRAEAAIAANAWVLKVPHVKGMNPKWIMDESVPRDEAIEKGTGVTGIRVWVDKPENVREVQGRVPSQLDGVPVVVEANRTDGILLPAY